MTRARQTILANIASRIAGLHRPHPTRVAIDGVDAAGKTTLADELAPDIARLGRPVIRASIDGFHNPRATRRLRGSMSPEGYFHDSFNYSALVEVLLQPLGPGGSRAFRRAVFDFRTDERLAAEPEVALSTQSWCSMACFSCARSSASTSIFSVFIRADFAVTTQRAEQRDIELFGSVEEVRRRYRERYVPGQQLYLNLAQPERWATLVLDNNDPTTPHIQGAV